MPVRHVVCFRFHPGTTPDQVAAVAAGLRELPGIIPEIVDYHAEPDLGINPTSWDFSVTADFRSEADYLTYRDHPDHQDHIARLVTPITAERAAVQIAL